MDSEDSVRLTSFRPLSPDTTRSSFSLARLFQRKRPEARVAVKVDISKKQRPRSPLVSPQSSPQLQKRASIPYASTINSDVQRSWSSSPLIGRNAGYQGSPVIGGRIRRPSRSGNRNVHAVLGRLNAAADGRGQLRQEYKESNFKQYWMPDENCKECYECEEKFNTFRRRHHCRLCGQIFCYRCCYLEIPGQLMGYSGYLRACTYCFKVVQRYTQSSADVNMVRNLEQLQSEPSTFTTDPDTIANPNGLIALSKTYPYDLDDENFYGQPSLRKGSNSSTNAMSCYLEKFDQKERPLAMPGRRPFDAFGVCAAEADMLKQDSFRELWNQIMSPRSGLELQCHRYRLRTYQNCLVGSELVDWLLTYEKTSTRNQAVMIGQDLLEFGWLEPVPNTRDGGAVFKDEYILYQPGMTAREVGTPKKSSLFWSDDKPAEKNESLSDSHENDKNVDDDNDETVPHWFRQLEQQSIDLAVEEFNNSNNHELTGKVNNLKATGPKLLDLDLMNGLPLGQGNSELSLKVDLNHFGEAGKLGSPSFSANYEAGGSKLSLITDVPPPPLEQYVYNEGYPYTPLRPSTKKANEGGSWQALSTSCNADEIFSGALMTKEVVVDRSPSAPDLSELREDNGERLAMERLRTAHSYHLNALLVQLLKDAGLSVDWKDTILPLVKRISEQVTPDVRKDDDMDICEYVKFKKIPGGNKSDCEMISGVVFTKNIANKRMASVLSYPKILVLSCAVDYQRNENRLASLDPLILQEYEFLKNFVARVVSLRPNILLVEKTVSRLAQDMLLQHGITLVLNIKPKVIERIARCTRADVLCSMEQLSRPQLGMCQSFKVQRYSLKNGEFKTLIVIDGCPIDLGCTVNLRGGNSFVLTKVKRIFQHMVYVAYSLKLELHFLMDEFALPPDPSHLIEENEVSVRKFEEKMKVVEHMINNSEQTGEIRSAEISKQDSNKGSELFLAALKSTVLSSSPSLDYPLPYLLTEAGRNFPLRSTLPADIYWSARIDVERNLYHLTEEDLEQFEFSNLPHRCLSKFVSLLEPHPFVSASLTMEHKDQFFQALLSDFRAQGGQIQLTRNGKTVSRGKSSLLEGVFKTRCSQSMERTASAQENLKLTNKLSEEFNERKEEKNNPSLSTSALHVTRKSVDCLDPYAHQRIAVLFISYSDKSNNSPRPCISPWAVFMEFYGRNDITLGGFLEMYCFRPSYICPNPNCDVPMVDHVRYFAHGTGSVYIHMRNLESPIPGFQHTILTWSWCQHCKQVTPIVPLSAEAWALSFAKYLELRFYAGSYKRRASVEPCGHSLHKDHYQYFAYANMVASFKYRPIKLFEIAIPPPKISIKEETRDASLWLNDIQAMATRGDTVFAAFCDSLESLRDFFSSQPDRQARMQQFFVALRDEHTRFREQVDIVEKKAFSLRTPLNPLATENDKSSEHLGPEDRQALEYVIANSLNSLKKTLCEAVDDWNNSLQDYIQAEKKKNSKMSSTKEGKFLSSSMQIDGKSAEQMAKSPDVTANQGDNPNLLDANPSPSLTPWGSRSASPYPSLDKAEIAEEMLSVADMEVVHITSIFQPIPNQDVMTNIETGRDSLSEGILPVGGVVKGHPVPSEKSDSIVRVKLERNDTLRQKGETLEAFVAIEPNSEEPSNHEAERLEEASQVKRNANKSFEEKMAGEKQPCGAKTDVVNKLPFEFEVTVAKEPTLVKMDDAKEACRVNMGDTEGITQIKMPSGKVPSVGKICGVSPIEKVDCAKASVERDSKEVKRASSADNREKETSSWYTVERAQEDSQMEEPVQSQQSPIQEQFSVATELKSEESGKTIQASHPISVVKARTFPLGHRRVASSPPSITVMSFENRLASSGQDYCETTCLERSRSDSDIRAHGRQHLDKSHMLTDGNLESGDDTDTINQLDKENMADANDGSGSDGKDIIVKLFRKVNTMPSTLKSRNVARSQSWAVNQWQITAKKALANDGDLDAPYFNDGSSGSTRRGKVKRIVSSFMSSPAFQPVASTFPSHEHHLLPPGEKVLVVVSEKETSSIIAYTLSTTEYNERLHEIQRTLSDIKNEATQLAKSEFGKSVDVFMKGQQTETGIHHSKDKYIRVDSGSDSGEGYVQLDIVDPETYHGTGLDGESVSVSLSDNLDFMNTSVELKAEPDHFSKLDSMVKHTKNRGIESSSAQEGQVQDDIELVQFGFQRKDVTKDPVEFHVKHQFADNTCRFYCSIYYAEQFRLLRKRIFPDSEEKYIRSLQHSVAWGARGGKSGSAFYKSLDDRFVMKQMSRQELQCFLEFAPHYFRYVNKALDEQRPTLLAKILGIYRIGFKNSLSGATMRQDALVMENLFYGRNIDKTFDLKGSMRSRYVQTSGMNNDVLLDENLLEMIRERPIFFRPHSKAILSRAIHNDTEFLAQQMVMDYSLLVGIDEARSELVTGIIDFIRTFTWDKRLEMYVKASGILGGQGRMPTVVSPELYRTRFTEAMHRYFLMVPDKWTGLGNDLD